MRHLPEVFAEKVHEAHIRREDVPVGLLEPRPFRPRPRPKTALISEACQRKYEERITREAKEKKRPRSKYNDSDFVKLSGARIRKLRQKEITEFRAGIARILAARVRS